MKLGSQITESASRCAKFFWRRLANRYGMTLLMLLFTIVISGILLTVVAKQWKMVVQREAEADLLAKGIEIQNAISRYSTAKKAGRVIPGEIYPKTLGDLVKPPTPFLRKVYLDPVARAPWDLIRSPSGGIMGVRSKSSATPIRQHNFPLAVRHFEGLQSYKDWLFIYPNPSLQQNQASPAVFP